jgi:pimeloyl-ACP methyl ester carboxylesterase
MRSLYLLALTAVISCSQSDHIDDFAPHHLTNSTLLLTSGGVVEIERGEIDVPAVRKDPSLGTYSIAYARLRQKPNKNVAPLVHLQGGPGDASIPKEFDEHSIQQWLPYLDVVDVILFDQRGTGASDPASEWTWQLDRIPDDFFLSEAAALDHRKAIDSAARQHFDSLGIPLTGFSTIESAADVNDLRRALGLKKISLFGHSYGTHLGLAVLREYEQFVERAILIGVEGPDHTAKLPLTLDRQLERISALYSLQQYPVRTKDSLARRLMKLQERLATSPLRIQITLPGGRPREFDVGPFGLSLALMLRIGRVDGIVEIPRLLAEVGRGDVSLLQEILQRYSFLLYYTSAMALITDAVSGASIARREEIEIQKEQSIFGDVGNILYRNALTTWRAQELPPSFRSSVHSQVPTLFIAGDLDWNTPAWQAVEVMAGFQTATLITVVNAGHERILPYKNRALAAIVHSFLLGQKLEVMKIVLDPLEFVPEG